MTLPNPATNANITIQSGLLLIQANGLSLNVLGQTLTGDFTFQQVTLPAAANSAAPPTKQLMFGGNNVSLTFTAGTTPVASLTQGQGFFVISSSGLAGQVSGSVAISGLSLANLTVQVNTGMVAVNQSLTVGTTTLSLNLPAGPYVRIAGTGLAVNLLGQQFTADLSFQQSTDGNGNKVVSVTVANLSISLGDGTHTFVSLTGGVGFLNLTAQGLVGSLNGTLNVNVPGVTLGGNFSLALNQTGQPVQVTFPVGNTYTITLPAGTAAPTASGTGAVGLQMLTVTPGAGANQYIVSVVASGGTFTLTANNQTTAPISVRASNTDVLSAVQSLFTSNQNAITVTQGSVNQTFNLPAGPYVRVAGTGVMLTLLQQSLSGDFTFEQTLDSSGNRLVKLSVANAALTLGGSTPVVSITNGRGNLLITSAGLDGSIGGTVAVNVPGVTLGGTLQAQFNTLTAPVTQSITIGNTYTVTFAGGTAPTLTADGTNLSGGLTATVAVTTPGNAGTSEVQTVTVVATGGTFTLSFNGQTTAALAYNATAAQVQTALTGLSSIGNGNVAVTLAGNTYTVTFQGTLANENVSALAIDGTNLKVNPSASVAVQTPGGSQSEVQTLTVLAGGGTFTLSFNGQTTTALAFNAAASDVQNALTALSNIGTGNVAVTLTGNTYTITFQGTLANQSLALLTVNTANLTGPTPTVTATTQTAGGNMQNNVQQVTVTAAGGGTYTLTFQANANDTPQTTAAIAYNASATAVQNALAALSNVGSGNVTVTQAGNVYTITFQGTLGNQNLLPLTATTTALLPVTGTPTVAVTPSTSSPTSVDTVTVQASGGTFTLTFGNQTTAPIPVGSAASALQSALQGLSSVGASNVTVTLTGNAYTVTFLNGVTGTLAASNSGLQPQATANRVTAGQPATSAVQTVTVIAGGGTFTLSFQATPTGTAQTTAPIAYNASASAVQSALAALSNIGTGNVAVMLTGNVYTITFQGTLANLNLPVLSVSGANLLANGQIASVAAATGNAQTVTVNAGGGTFTLSFNGQTTAPIAYNASAATVQGALVALSNIGRNLQNQSNVSVTATTTGTATVYTITFVNGLATPTQPLLTINGTALTATAVVAIMTPGVPSASEVQQMTVAAGSGTFTLSFNGQTTAALAYNATAAQVQTALAALSNIGTGNVTVTQSGNTYTVTFQGTLANQTLAALLLNSSALVAVSRPPSTNVTITTQGGPTVSEVQQVSVVAGGGTFTLTFNGQTTAPLAYNATAAQVQTALVGLSSIGSGNVAVAQSSSTYTITFQGTLANMSEPVLSLDGSLLVPLPALGLSGSGNNYQISVAANGGTYTLTVGGQQTTPIPFGASAADVQAAIAAALMLINSTATATVTTAPITQTTSLPAGPFVQVQGTGITLNVLGQTLTGNFAFQQMNDGAGNPVTLITADHVSLSLGSGSTPAVSVTNGHGYLVITSAGIAGSLSATVALNVPGVSFSGTFGISLNQTSMAVNETLTLGTQTVNLTEPAGPFLQVSGQGLTLNIAGQTLTGNFAFEQVTDASHNQVIRLAASNVSLNLGNGTTNFVQVTNGQGSFLLTSAGFAGQLSATVVINIPGVTVTGTFGVAINNTTAAVNDTLTLADGSTVTLNLPAGPYVHVTVTNASLTILGQTLSGNFSFERTLDASGNPVILVSGSNIGLTLSLNASNYLQVSNGTLEFLVNSAGVAGTVSGTVSLNVAALGLSSSAQVTVTVSTMTVAVNQQFTLDGVVLPPLNIQAGPFFRLEVDNLSLQLMGLAVKGNFTFERYTQADGSTAFAVNALGNPGLTLQIGTATTFVTFTGTGALLVTSAGVAAQVSGTIATTNIPLAFNGNLTLDINTTSAAVSQTFTGAGQTFMLTLPAGPFIRIVGNPVSVTVAGKGLSGSFSFEQSNNAAGHPVIRITVANLSLSLGNDTANFVNVSNASGYLVIDDSGFAGQLSATIGLTLPGITFAGNFAVSIAKTNSTALNETFNDVNGNPITVTAPANTESVTVTGQSVRLTVLNQTLQGNFGFQENTTAGVKRLVLTASNVSLGLGDPNNPFVNVTGGSGTFLVTSAGLAGTLQATVTVGSFLSGTFQLNINNTTAAINQTFTLNNVPTTLNLPAGPFLQVQANNVSLSILGQTLTGNFSFTQTGSGATTLVTLAASNVGLTITSGGSPIFTVTNGQGSFQVTSGGIAGSLSANLTTAGSPVDSYFSLTTTVGLAINTQSVAANGLPAGPYVRVTATNTDVTIGGSHTLHGDFYIDQYTKPDGTTITRIAALNLSFAGDGTTQGITGAEGGMVIENGGVAGVLSGQLMAGSGSTSVSATATLSFSTLNVPVDETITVNGHSLTINLGAGPLFGAAASDLELNIANFVSIEGSISFTSQTINGQSVQTFAGAGLAIFLGAGPYKNPDGTINSNAVGVLLNNAQIGVIKFPNGTFALYATGDISLLGVDGLTVTGSATVMVNTTGTAINQTLTIPNPSAPGGGGSVMLNFPTAAVVTSFVGTIHISVAGVLDIQGTVSFTKKPDGTVVVDISNASVAITINGQQAFSVGGQVDFTLGGTDGFQLQDIYVNSFSIYGVSATLPTPPAPVQPPSVDLANPYEGQILDRNTLNTQGYFDVQVEDPNNLGINSASILTTATKVTLSENGMPVTGVTVNQLPTQVPNEINTYRFSFTGSFTQPGDVEVDFATGVFQDNGGNGNLAQTGHFTLVNGTVAGDPPGAPPPSTGTMTAGPMAKLSSPKDGKSLSVDTMNSSRFIDVTYKSRDGSAIDPTTITGKEFKLSGPGVTNVAMLGNGFPDFDGPPTLISGTTYRYYLKPADPTNANLFGPGEVDVNFQGNSVGTLAGNKMNASTEKFTLTASTATSTGPATAGKSFTIGPLNLQGPSVGIADIGFQDGLLILELSVSVNQATLSFSGVTAKLTSVLGLLDVGVDVFGLLSGHVRISVPGNFTFRVGSLEIDVPNVVNVTASGIVVTYNPDVNDGVTVTKAGDASDSAVQAINVISARGAFTLSYNGNSTPSIAVGATAATVQSDLEALPGIGTGNVKVTTAGTGYTVTFQGALANMAVAQLGITGSIPDDQQLVVVESASVMFPTFGVTGSISPFNANPSDPNSPTIPGLVVRANGFQLGTAELTYTPTSGQPISIPGILSFNDLRIGVQNFGMTFGGSGGTTFNGSIFFASGGATFLPGKPVSASITYNPALHHLNADGTPDTDALRATLTFSNGQVNAFQFYANTLSIQLSSLLTLTAQGVMINTGASASQPLASFISVGAQVNIGSLSIGGEARNFEFLGDGTFVPLTGFGVFLTVGSTSGGGVGWPSWLPIQIEKIGLIWPNGIQQDPGDFILDLSASVMGLKGVPGLTFSGEVTDIMIQPSLLLQGQFPIIGIGSLGVTVTGNVFGGTISGGLVGGLLRISANNTIIDPTDTTTPVVQRVFYLGVEAGFTFAGMAGFTIRFGLSALGPLDVFIEANIPGGIDIGGPTGISIDDFAGGVEFFKTLPSITNPEDLRNSDFGLPTSQTAAQWQASLQQQVLQQFITLQSHPGENGFLAAFTSPMLITASAKVFDIYTSQALFNGMVLIKISTDGKFLISGTLNFFNGALSISGKLYADLSHVANGSVVVLFLADIPDQVRLLTIEGSISMGFRNASGQMVTFQTTSETAPASNAMPPTATLADPSGSTVDVNSINGSGHLDNGNQYIDVEYMATTGAVLDYNSILNPTGTPLTIMVNGSAVTVSGTPTPMVTTTNADGTTSETPLVPNSGESMTDALMRTGVNRFRYDITQPNFTWPLGPVTVTIPAGAFKDADTMVNGNTVTGTANAVTTFTFTVVGATATLNSPGNGAGIDINALNSRGYIDVTFNPAAGDTLDPTSFTTAAPKFSLSGSAAAGVTLSNTAPTLVNGTTYRFAFTGQFTTGVVTVNFIAGTFKDQGDTSGSATGNLADTQSFTVNGTTADVTNPAAGGSIGLTQINSQGFIEVTFHPTQGHNINTAAIAGGEVTLTDPNGNNVPLGTPTQVAGTAATFDYPFTGALVLGTYTVTFVAGKFSDDSGATNLQATETFIVAGATAATANPMAGETVDRETLNGQGYIDVTFTPTPGATVDTTSIVNAPFTLTGANGENITVNPNPTLVAGTTSTYRYTFTGSWDTGTVTVNFIAGAWKDSAGNRGMASTETFTIITNAQAFFINISGAIILNAAGLTSSPLMEVQAQAQLEIDTVRSVFTLTFSGQMSIYKLGTVGSTAGIFILDTNPQDGSAPLFWGVATVQTNFSVLEQYGIYINASGTLQINTTSQVKTETLTLPGIGPDGGDLTQTYMLAAQSFSLEVVGSLKLQPPGTSSALLNLNGGFYIKIDPTEFEIYATASLSFGSGSSTINYAMATGLLIVKTGLDGTNPGVAGSFKIAAGADIGLPNVGSIFSATGSVTVTFNTTLQDQTFMIPDAFLPLLPPGAPTSITIFAGVPKLDGTRDPNAQPAVYIVATIQADLNIGGVLDLTGFLQISVGVNATQGQLIVTGAVSTNISFLGSLTGTLNLVVTISSQPGQSGVVGRVFLALAANKIPGVQLDGQFLLEINTFSTTQTVSTFAISQDANGNFDGFEKDANGNLMIVQQPIASGFRLVMSGSLTVASIVQIQGYFSFTINASGMDIVVNGHVVLGPLGSIQLSGELSVTSAGLFAFLDVSAGIGSFGQSVGLTFSASFFFEINTTGATVTTQDGHMLQPGFLLDIQGSVSFGSFAQASGEVMVMISNNAFELYFNVMFQLGPLNVSGTGFAGIYNDSSPGLALDLSVSLDFDILGGIFHISASGSLEINTTNQTRGYNNVMIPANIFRLMLSGQVDILAVLHFNASFVIQVGGGSATVPDTDANGNATTYTTNLGMGQWIIAVNASMDFFGLATVQANGWLQSNGNFHLHVSGMISLGSSTFGLSGYLTFDIRLDDHAFTVSGSGGVSVHIFGISFGVDINFSLTALRTGGRVPLDLHVGITLHFFFFSISVGADFTIGYVTIPAPIYLAGSQSDPTSFSGGTLYLNTGPRSGSRGIGEPTDSTPVDEDYTIDDLGGTTNGETIKVTAFGRSQTFTGVTGIVGDMGNGNNNVVVDPGVKVPVTLVGGSGNNIFDDSGSGPATLDVRNEAAGTASYLYTGPASAAGSVFYGGAGTDNIVHYGTGPATIYGGTGDGVTTGSGVSRISSYVPGDVIHGSSAGGEIDVNGGYASIFPGGGQTLIKWPFNTANGTTTVAASSGQVTIAAGSNTTGQNIVISHPSDYNVEVAGYQGSTFQGAIKANSVAEIDVDSGTSAGSVTIGSLRNANVPKITVDLGATAVPNGTVTDSQGVTMPAYTFIPDGTAKNVLIQGDTGSDHFVVSAIDPSPSHVMQDVQVVDQGITTIVLYHSVRSQGDTLTVNGGGGSDILDASGLGNPLDTTNTYPDLIAVSLIAGAGNSMLIGGPYNETLEGGQGSDTFVGGGALDTFISPTSTNTLIQTHDSDMSLFGNKYVIGSILGTNGGAYSTTMPPSESSLDGVLMASPLPNLVPNNLADHYASGAIVEDITGIFANVIMQGGAHNNTLVVGNKNGVIYVGGVPVHVTPFTGSVTLNNMGDTADPYTENYVISTDGQSGANITIAPAAVQAGSSQLIVNGTDGADNITLNAAGSGASRTGTVIFGDPTKPGHSTITYQGVQDVLVSTFGGNDNVLSNDTAALTVVNFGSGNDNIQVGTVPLIPDPGNRTLEYPNGVPVANTSAMTNGNSNPLFVLGGTGNDNFEVDHNRATLYLHGGAGNNLFLLNTFLVLREDPTNSKKITNLETVFGGTGTNRYEYLQNAPVDIIGGPGTNTLVVIGTPLDDTFIITNTYVAGAGRIVTFSNIQSIVVDGAGGNDNIWVLSTAKNTFVTVAGGTGDNTIHVGGTPPPLVFTPPSYTYQPPPFTVTLPPTVQYSPASYNLGAVTFDVPLSALGYSSIFSLALNPSQFLNAAQAYAQNYANLVQQILSVFTPYFKTDPSRPNVVGNVTNINFKFNSFFAFLDPVVEFTVSDIAINYQVGQLVQNTKLVTPPPVTVQPAPFALMATGVYDISGILGHLRIDGGVGNQVNGNTVIVDDQLATNAAAGDNVGSLQLRQIPQQIASATPVNGKTVFTQATDPTTGLPIFNDYYSLEGFGINPPNAAPNTPLGHDADGAPYYGIELTDVQHLDIRLPSALNNTFTLGATPTSVTNPPPPMSIDIEGGLHNDTYNIQEARAPVAIHGGPGQSTLNVSNNSHFGNILSNVTFDGDTHLDETTALVNTATYASILNNLPTVFINTAPTAADGVQYYTDSTGHTVAYVRATLAPIVEPMNQNFTNVPVLTATGVQLENFTANPAYLQVHSVVLDASGNPVMDLVQEQGIQETGVQEFGIQKRDVSGHLLYLDANGNETTATMTGSNPNPPDIIPVPNGTVDTGTIPPGVVTTGLVYVDSNGNLTFAPLGTDAAGNTIHNPPAIIDEPATEGGQPVYLNDAGKKILTPVQLAANTTLTFTHVSTAGDTITRNTGSWITDGFEVGNVIYVSGTNSNNGSYTISAIDTTGKVLTLSAADHLHNETITGATVQTALHDSFVQDFGVGANCCTSTTTASR